MYFPRKGKCTNTGKNRCIESDEQYFADDDFDLAFS